MRSPGSLHGVPGLIAACYPLWIVEMSGSGWCSVFANRAQGSTDSQPGEVGWRVVLLRGRFDDTESQPAGSRAGRRERLARRCERRARRREHSAGHAGSGFVFGG
ncbi:hypothetical protein AMIS_11620 [Actinoplanes missouriensis 431]|uniref:Uncharacterized protein n=1 Tax=Actinoplanes missouriensis (strain ATCC 14538 / DSM 43046 / CBS 188.64 / JCM 3121 / NBRC 102363 / NCIMB 12654 / NRRL B-3342 / UNCC 431) TaxID=512565 RepID=I0H045_ACTM4|nr:hypothetical protein AMIS_11620 [Actinoplanes missouriensis 431]